MILEKQPLGLGTGLPNGWRPMASGASLEEMDGPVVLRSQMMDFPLMAAILDY